MYGWIHMINERMGNNTEIVQCKNLEDRYTLTKEYMEQRITVYNDSL